MAYSGAQITRLGLSALARGLYGSFAGKAETITLLGVGAGYSSIMSNDGIGLGSVMTNDGIGAVGIITNDGIGTDATISNDGIGVGE